MERAPFNYDRSNIFSDLLMAWAFPMLSFWSKTKPSPLNLVEIPKRIAFNQCIDLLEKEWEKETIKPKPSFRSALLRVIGFEFLKACAPGIFGYNLVLVQSILVIYLTRYMTDENAKGYEGAGYVIAYGSAAILSYYLMNLSTFRIYCLIAKLKGAIPCLIYKKVLNISNMVISQGNARGKLANVIASEVEFFDGLVTMVFLLSAPTFLVAAFFILGFLIGPAGIIGLLIIIFHFPIIIGLGKISGKFRMRTAMFADSRVKMITNLVEGIRIVKLYGWENPYLGLIFNKRLIEINEAHKKQRIMSTNRMLGNGSVGLMLFVTFVVYVYLGNEMEPGVVFAAVTILVVTNNLVCWVGAAAIIQLFMLAASMNRITEALTMKKKGVPDYERCKKHSLNVKNASFSWSDQYFNQITKNDNQESNQKLVQPISETSNALVLNDVNFRLRPGELLVVIGPVGCGKSSLFMGLLKEIAITSGKIGINGKFAYAGEDPWIVSTSIRDNILMGAEFNETRYKEVIHACALEKDIELFKFGDNTVVGDRGITLSGGQKSRVSLARAIYTNRDVMFLDDPLSAVDAQVSQHIFKHCIKGYLKGKTVILATHQIHVMSEADKILVLDKGTQLFFGTYEELQQREDVFHIVGELMNKVEEKDTAETPETLKEEKKIEVKDKLSIQEEERAVGSVPIKSYFRYLLYGFRTACAFPLLILLIFCAQATFIGVMWWLALWARASEDDQHDSGYIWIYGIIVGLNYGFSFIRSFVLTSGMLNSAKRLHNSALEGMTKAETVFFDKNPTGRMINRFSKDTFMMDELLIMIFVEFINTSLSLLGNMVVLSIVAPPNIAVVGCFVIYILFMIYKVVPISKDLRRIELTSKSPILSLCNSSVHGLVTIRSLNLEPKFIDDMHSIISLSLRSFLSYQVVLRFYQGYVELAATLVNVLNVIVLVLYKDNISSSLGAMTISLVTSMSSLVAFWAKTMVETDNLMASPQRLMEYADIPKEGEFESSNEFKIDKGKIEVKNLFMRYRENFPYALQDLSFTLEAGEKVGIIGRTGAGKSTIMQVLFRLTNPSAGTIYIDGQDYRVPGLHQLRKQMSVIPQSPTIFLASFRDNLDPFHEHSDDDILNILKQTRLSELVSSYPRGLSTMLIGEGGNLSAGQKQLVCLARALIRKNKIVMMDEATANVDPETDMFIQGRIKKMFKKSTLLIVAHRLRTIIDTDKIIVMDEGTCKESGTPHDLGNDQNSLFRKMIMHTGPQESHYLLTKLINSD